jgi:hypothetical protein
VSSAHTSRFGVNVNTPKIARMFHVDTGDRVCTVVSSFTSSARASLDSTSSRVTCIHTRLYMSDGGIRMRASHVLIKHCESRNPVSRRTDLSTENVTVAAAREELSRWRDELLKDSRPMPEKFAALAHHRSDCGSFQAGGDLGEFGPGEMQEPFEQAAISLPVGEVSGIVSTDSGLHLIYRTA